MADIILIAGTYYGGWYWQNLVANLSSSGHRVFAPTLRGLGEDSPSDSPISLSDHIQEVVDMIDDNNLDDVVLVGWSYGGMVITGVPARVQAKIAHLVYLDAAVPVSGQTEFDLIPDWLRAKQLAECLDGRNQFPSAEFLNYEPRMKPHPIGTKQEPISYDEVQLAGLAKTYVVAGKERGSGPFAEVVARISSETNWRIIELDAGHDVYRDSPEEVERIIFSITAKG